jgi:hypothetical protein
MDVWVRTRELLNSLADVTESGSRIARFKIEVANLDRKLGLALRRIGERVWQAEADGRPDVLGDAEVRAALDEVRRLSARMEVIRQEVERNRTRATGELGRAARMVKDEAGRTADVVRREAERAASIVREEAGRAGSALRKAVESRTGSRKKSSKETTDFQP